MKPPVRRLFLLLPAALLGLLPLAFARQEARQEPSAGVRLQARTVVLVRHAEKSKEGDPDDPELSAEGKERAGALARLLVQAGVSRLVASEYRRTKDTLAPLAELRKLAIEERPAREVEQLASELASAEPGSVTVVCGHSNTIPALAARLGAPLSGLSEGPQGPVLEDSQYDRLFVLYLPPGGSGVRPTVLELRYGN